MSNKTPINIIFAGTPDFALPSLRELAHNDNFKIIAVITQPDREAGRGQNIKMSPVKQEALANNLEVWQPNKIKEIKDKIIAAKPDLIVIIAYGQIIPEELLAIPAFGWINIHGSLLPKYRGAACVQAPILAGDKTTGVSIIKINKGLDTGPILKQTEIDIRTDETAETLHDKLADLGAKILPETLKLYLTGKITPVAQDNSLSSYVPTLKKSDGKISWQKPAEEIEKMVRAYNPWPGAFTELAGKEKIGIKIKKAGKILPINKHKPGEIFLSENLFCIQCGVDALVIEKIQLEGKKEMTAEEFLRGHKEFVGKIFSCHSERSEESRV